MKKIFNHITVSILSIIVLFSCNSELDSFNIDPNNPSSLPPNILLSQAEVSTFAIHSTGLARLSNMFTQHLAGTSEGQYGKYANYNIAENDVTNEWDAIYSNALINAELIQKLYNTDYPYYSGISKVLTAINLSYATDFWNDVPYTEALKGLEGNTQPSYDKQEDIYTKLQVILTDAITLLSNPSSSNASLPGADDLIFGGDVNKWITSAYVLKARFAMRLGKSGDAASFIQKSGISSNSEDLEAVFFTEGNSNNQWFAFESGRANYLKMGKFFIDQMVNTNDPRLKFFATKDSNGAYSGNTPDDITTTTTSGIGPYIASADKNLGMVTYVEAKFIEAEALLSSNPSKAASAFKSAVEASLQKVTGSIDATFVNNVTSVVNLENIITQKYVALFSSMEPYNDFRRTGFPSLTPNPKGVISNIPLRLPTPQNQRLYNPNAKVVSNMTTPVWWDK